MGAEIDCRQWRGNSVLSPARSHNVAGSGRLIPAIEAATDFMLNSRAGNDMHQGEAKGTYVFAMAWTTDIAKAFGYDSPSVTGLMVAFKPPPELLAKFVSGEYCGFLRLRTGIPIDRGQSFQSIADSIPIHRGQHSNDRGQFSHRQL
jgi:hypothetical protein